MGTVTEHVPFTQPSPTLDTVTLEALKQPRGSMARILALERNCRLGILRMLVVVRRVGVGEILWEECFMIGREAYGGWNMGSHR